MPDEAPKSKRVGGRPSKYKPDFPEQAKKLAVIGAIDAEIADFFNVKESTFYEWKKKYPELTEALKNGKDICDSKVIKSLFKRAIGFDYTEIKSEGTVDKESGEVKGKKVTRTTKHVAPDVGAAAFWLKNRRRDEWRDKWPDGGDVESIAEALKQLAEQLPD